VELMPVAEHAFYPSWGYQVTGFYAPTRRYGTPEDLQSLINALHNAGYRGDHRLGPGSTSPGTTGPWLASTERPSYEHEDPRQGEHQDWGTLIFNFGRHEVRTSSIAQRARAGATRYHVRRACAWMPWPRRLTLDYSRKEGEWIPNKMVVARTSRPWSSSGASTTASAPNSPARGDGGRGRAPRWPMASRPPWIGGLGFTLKWNMGWMHDTLGYFARDPIHRRHHQDELTFAMLYHGHENFVLPLSHDEVVARKGSLRRRMPGDDWQAFANLRALLGYQWFFPGKKLLFMGWGTGPILGMERQRRGRLGAAGAGPRTMSGCNVG
jgi:1,4-alpha-glucan branching enzyme